MTQEEIDNLKFGDLVTSNYDIGVVIGRGASSSGSQLTYIVFEDDGLGMEIGDSDYMDCTLLQDEFQLHKKEPKYKHIQRFVSKLGLCNAIDGDVCGITIISKKYSELRDTPVIISYREEDVE